MLRKTFGLLALVVLATSATWADEAKDEMVDNPKYKFWAGFKVGATSVLVEKNVLHGEEKGDFPGGVDEKTITYQLLSVSADKVVIRATVVENEHLGTVESAPTKITYSAKIKKAHLAAVLAEFGAKAKDEPEMVKAAGKEIKCKVLEGSSKKGDESFEYKLCYSEEVPGGVVKRTRTAKRGDKLVAETTISVKSFKDGAPKAPKTPK